MRLYDRYANRMKVFTSVAFMLFSLTPLSCRSREYCYFKSYRHVGKVTQKGETNYRYLYWKRYHQWCCNGTLKASIRSLPKTTHIGSAISQLCNAGNTGQ